MLVVVMRVAERMTRRLVTIEPGATLAEARALLDAHRIRHLPVVAGGRLVGILSDRDIRSAGAGSAAERMRVADAMTTRILTISPEAQVEEAATLMIERQLGGLPVVKGGELVGILTETDLLKAFVELLETATLERIAPDYRP